MRGASPLAGKADSREARAGEGNVSQLQDAKNRFSKLVQKAQREGPQTVTLRGRRAAVVLSAEAYDALLRERPSLVDHLLSGPAWDDDLVEAVNFRAKTPSRPPAV